jgi:hypothetical protein
MKVKIYLNDGEDHFFGFKNQFANNPELTMVHEFEISQTEMDWIYKRFSKDFVINVLEYVFEETNVGEESKLAQDYRGKRLRSLSVGDVVTVGETAWSVDSIGWGKVTTEELNSAIIWDDTIKGISK